MRRTMMTMSDQQYNALVASRSGGGPSGVSSRLLPPSQGAQYLSQKLYGDRVDPYHPATVGSGLGGSALPYAPSANRATGENYSDAKELRAQLAAERRGGGLLPSPTLVDYSPTPFVDHAGSRGVLPAPTVSSEAVGAYHRGGQTLSNAELLAARARRSELAASYQSGYGSEVPVRRIAPASSYDDPGLLPGQAAGILGAGGVRRGRELDRYLLSVQPEKLVRYASSILDPALKRNGYPTTVENDLNPDEDMYSNYRRAKARRMGVPEFGDRGEPPSRRDRDGEVSRVAEHYQERKGRQSGRELGKRSPDRRHTNGSLSKGNDANRVDHPNNASQSFGGRRGQQNARQNGGQNGGSNKRSRDSEKVEKVEKGAGAKGKVEDPNSDKDSELGSLCADLSDSDEEKVEKKSEEAATVIDGPLAGMIFGCSSATFHECMRLQLFGLPAKSKEEVLRVTPGTKVFLFNFDTKELSGIFEAVSHGGWQIQPDAFRDFGGFPAQVQVCCPEQCPNIPQSMFKAAIKENYVSSTRFRFDLNTKQVRELVRMFRQTAGQLPRQVQDPMTDRYLSARAPPEEYIARGGPQQQRPYARHPQARFGTSRVVPYDDARVMMISMSANKTTNIRKRSKRRASKRALLKKGRKKRKVSTTPSMPESPPLPPMADNCSLYSLSGEMVEGADDLGLDDETSNPKSGVIVFRDGIDTGSSRNVVHQPKEIVETPSPAVKAIAPPSGLSPSKPHEEDFPQPQSDLGKQEVSFLEDDSYNDGNFRLAGSRADEQGQGLGHDVPLQGALSSGNVIKSSDCTLSSMGEGLCSELQGVFSITTGPAEALVNLGGNNTPSQADCDCQLSELDDEKRSREGLGDIGVPTHEKCHTSESIFSDLGTGEKLPDVHTDGVFIETVEEEADCTLFSVGKDDEELEEIAAEVAIGPEAPCIIKEMMVATADIAIWPEDACIREDMMVAAEFAADSEDSLVIKEVMIASSFVCKHDDLGVIAAEVATDCEAPCCVDAMMVVAGFAGKDKLELTDIDSGAPIVIEEATVASAVVGKDDEELGVLAAEVAIDSEGPLVIEEATVASAVVGKDDEELGILAAEVAIDSEDPLVIEEATIASAIVGKDDEELGVLSADVAIDSKAPIVVGEAMIAAAIVGKDDEELGLIAAEVAIDSEAPCVAGEDVMIAAEVAVDSEIAFVKEGVMISAGAVGKDEVEVLATEVAIDSEAAVDAGAPFVGEEVMIAAEVVGHDEELEIVAHEVALESDPPIDREEEIINAEAVGNEETSEVIACEARCALEEVMIAAQTLRSQLLASADMDDIVTTVHDAGHRAEEAVLGADPVDSDQPPSPDLNVINGEDEDEEGVPAANAVDLELATSSDEDEDEREGLPAAILGADLVDSDQPPSPDLNVINGDDEDEEGVPAANAIDFELATSSDEDEDDKEGLPAANAVDFELATSSDEDEDEKEGLPAANAVDFELATSSDKDEDEKEGLPAANAVDFERAASPNEDEDEQEGRPAANAVDFERVASPNKDEDEQEGLPAANAVDIGLAASPSKDEDDKEDLLLQMRVSNL